MAEEHYGRRHRTGQTPGPAQAISALRSLRREGLAARESDPDDESHRHAGLSGQASRGGVAQEGSQTPRANDALNRLADIIPDASAWLAVSFEGCRSSFAKFSLEWTALSQTASPRENRPLH